MGREVDGRVFCGLPDRARCPACGYPPSLAKSTCGGSVTWFVECVNRDCPVMPASVGKTPRDAVDEWNCAAYGRRKELGGNDG